MYRTRNFINFEDFLLAARYFVDSFVQCIGCRSFRLVNGHNRFLQMFIDEFNDWAPDIDELKTFGFKISHGSCKLCVRNCLGETSRKLQAKEGHYPCYGTAIDGHCSEQGRCKYFNTCVVTREELEAHENWRNEHPKKNVLMMVLVQPEEICDQGYYFGSKNHETLSSSSLF